MVIKLIVEYCLMQRENYRQGKSSQYSSNRKFLSKAHIKGIHRERAFSLYIIFFARKKKDGGK